MRPHRRRPRRPRSGVTIVEILIALVLLTVAVGGLVRTSTLVTGQVGGGSRQTIAASVAQARLDSLTSLACATLATAGVVSGRSTTRGVQEEWEVVDGRNIKTINVTIRVPRRSNPLRYSMVIPCRD